MHMVRDSAHSLSESAEAIYGAAEVFVQSFPPWRRYAGQPVFCGENEMVMQ